mgnify:CR=1 FL=1
MQVDPLLIKEVSYSTNKSFDFYSLGLKALNENKTSIEKIGAIYNKIFDTNESCRNGYTMLSGAIFALGSKEFNIEWKEHCAGSLRELLHDYKDSGQIEKAFRKTYSCLPALKAERAKYDLFNKYYGFFSDIHHHQYKHYIHKLRKLKSNEELKDIDFTSELFTEIVKDFISLNKEFFKNI